MPKDLLAGYRFYIHIRGKYPLQYVVLSSPDKNGKCVVTELIRPIKNKQRYVELSPRMGVFFERQWDIHFPISKLIKQEKVLELIEKQGGFSDHLCIPPDILEIIISKGFKLKLFEDECRQVLEEEYQHLC